MKIPRLKVIGIAAAFVTLATVIVWQHWQNRRLMAEVAFLRRQSEQASIWREETRKLTDQVAMASDRSESEMRELLRLRGQSGRLRQVEQENNRLKAERDRRAKTPQPATEPEPIETPEIKLQRAKGFFARDLGMALLLAADANGGELPLELRGPVFEMMERLSVGAEFDVQAKQFEPVYTGSLADVKDVSATILAREKEPVQRPDGEWIRFYVLADGSSQLVSAPTPEAFVTREQELWPGQFKK